MGLKQGVSGSAGSGEPITIRHLDSDMVWISDASQVADNEPVKAAASLSNGECVTIERVAAGTAAKDRLSITVQHTDHGMEVRAHAGEQAPAGRAVKSDASMGNGECVTIRRVPPASVHADRPTLIIGTEQPAAPGIPVKGTASNYNGECVTVRRVPSVSRDGDRATVVIGTEQPAIPGAAVKGTASSYNGECVTVARFPDNELVITDDTPVGSSSCVTDASKKVIAGPVKSAASTGNGACVTVERLDNGTLKTWKHDDAWRQAQDGEPVKGASSVGGGACVTVQRVAGGSLANSTLAAGSAQLAAPSHPLVADGQPVKSYVSVGDGECVTVQRVADGAAGNTFFAGGAAGAAVDRAPVPAGEPRTGRQSTGNGECVTVRRMDGGQGNFFATDQVTVPAGQPVKSDRSLTNGECVTIERLGTEAGEHATTEFTPDGTFIIRSHIGETVGDGQDAKGAASIGNGECVTITRIDGQVTAGTLIPAEQPATGGHSISNGACVTLERGQAGDVALWDSKMERLLGKGNAPQWILTAAEWSEFIVGVRDGALSPGTLQDNDWYTNIVVSDCDDIEVERVLEDGELVYKWSFSAYPDIVHTYTEGEMHAFRHAAYTEQFGTDEWWDGSAGMVIFDPLPRELSPIG
jgi:hypothetical protein